MAHASTSTSVHPGRRVYGSFFEPFAGFGHTQGAVRSIPRWLRRTVALALWPAGASAAPPPIELDVKPCPDVDAAELRRIATIELGAEEVDNRGEDSGTTHVEVVCTDHVAEIRVLDPLTRKSLARTISLEGVAAPARSRLLALAVAELVDASWVELETNPEPVASPQVPAVQPAARVEAREAVRKRLSTPPPPVSQRMPPMWRVSALASLRWMSDNPSILPGAGVDVGVDVYRSLSLDLDLLVEHARTGYALGDVTTDLASVGAALGLRYELARFTLHTGAGLRVGVAHLQGQPSSGAVASGHDVTGPWAGPLLNCGARYTWPPGLTVELSAEGGYVVLPVRGSVTGASDIAADGALVGARLSAGWAF
jgi:hypothetical protein